MDSSQRAYEVEQFAKNHYQKLLSVKSSVKNYQHLGSSDSYMVCKSITPLDRYEYALTNNKLLKKLTEIYDKPLSTRRKLKRRKSRRGQTLSQSVTKKQDLSIQKENQQIVGRLMAIKSAIGQDWKQRERSLKKYSKLARKKTISNPSDTLYFAFRQIKVDEYGGKQPRRRLKSASVFRGENVL